MCRRNNLKCAGRASVFQDKNRPAEKKSFAETERESERVCVCVRERARAGGREGDVGV
jgi:hypothetical protein